MLDEEWVERMRPKPAAPSEDETIPMFTWRKGRWAWKASGDRSKMVMTTRKIRVLPAMYSGMEPNVEYVPWDRVAFGLYHMHYAVDMDTLLPQKGASIQGG